ncbi:MAG: SIMPL domain-containing protein [Anaerolineae bacterium]|nr:SIMPL domain-containing protein [Anaerolineae bacterium]
MMRKHLGTVVIVLVLAGLWLTGARPAAAQGNSDRTVTVTGEAEVRVVPDEVVLTLGVETWDKDLAKAKRDSDLVINRLLGLAEESGIEERQVQTDYLSIEPRYDDYYDRRQFLGYFVRKTVVVTLNDLSLFENFLSQALEAGVTHVHGIEFRTTELRKHRDQARALAVQAAQEKAAALCAELGEEVGRPTQIVEQYSRWWSPYSSWWGYGSGSSMMQNVVVQAGEGGQYLGSTAPGQITVTASVSVTFALK